MLASLLVPVVLKDRNLVDSISQQMAVFVYKDTSSNTEFIVVNCMFKAKEG